jgi:replicative DNA helicase
VDYGFAVVCKILSAPTQEDREIGLKKVINAGIHAEMLGPVRDKQLDYVLKHYKKFGAVIDKATFFSRFKSEIDIDTPEPIEYYIEEVKDSFLFMKLKNVREVIEEGLENDTSENIVKKALGILRECMITTKPMVDLEYSGSMDQRLQTYYQRTLIGDKITGVPTGISAIDSVVKGFKPGEYIVIHGRPESYKTYLTLFMAYNANKAGYRVLYVSREMPPAQLLMRVDSFYAKVDPAKIKHGFIDEEDFNLFRDALVKTKNSTEFVISGAMGDDNGAYTVEAVQAKIKEVRPQLVFLDGIYLMSVPGHKGSDWERLKTVSQGIKQLAMTESVPIVATSQTKKGSTFNSYGGDNVAFGDSLFQDADMMFSIGREWDHVMNTKSRVQWVKWDKTRDDSPGQTFYLDWNFLSMRIRESFDKSVFLGGLADPEKGAIKNSAEVEGPSWAGEEF